MDRNYERIDVVFIRHHTVAQEVDEETFFRSPDTGGTIVSTALEMMIQIVRERYASGNWNIYGAQASDGDNWDNDSVKCSTLMEKDLLPYCQYFAYIEITTGRPQNLWEEYQKVATLHPGHFLTQRIENTADIYHVFRELFKKR